MSRVKNRGTSAELYVRKALWSAGFRYRVNVRSLPGIPDLVLRRYHTVVMVQGCFWHGHSCRKGQRRPASNQDFWNSKLDANAARDAANQAKLKESGWTVFLIWECLLNQGTDDMLTHLRRMRELLNNEPHVRGLGYNQYADDDCVVTPSDRETFEQLADEWERDRPRGVGVEQMTKHLAYQRIIAMGEPVVPLLLQRLAKKPDHWFVALNAITGARPVPPESHGRIKEMTRAWLDWGRQQGYDLENH